MSLAEKRRIWKRCEHSYHTSFEHAGQPHRPCLNESDHERAKTRALEERLKVQQTLGPGGRQAAVTLEMLQALDIKRVRQAGKGKDREETIAGLFKPLFRLLGGKHRDVTTLKTADVPDYIGKRREETFDGEPIRGQTIRREVQALKRGIRLAMRDEQLHSSPIRWEVLPKIESDQKKKTLASKSWKESDILKVLEHMSARARNKGIHEALWLIRKTGLRLEEARLYDRDTWLRGDELHVLHDVEPRVIYLDREAVKIAKRYKTLPLSKPNKALALASKRAGFSVVLTPRDLRAFRLTELAQQSVVAAQNQAGHRNLSTTSIYVHADKDHVQQIVKAAGRKAKRLKVSTQGRHTKKQTKKTQRKSTGARSSAG